MTETQAANLPGTARIWWIGVRPFSFTASAMSVVFGTALAVTFGGARIDVPLFLLAVVGMVLLHAGANVLNDVYDYQRGLDERVFPVSGAVVRGYITRAQARRGAAVLFGAGAMIGLVIAARVGWPIVAIGAFGVAVGVLYSATPAGFKYHALGDLSVFVCFGLLGALGAWTAQTGSPSWLPVIWSTPLSLLVVGIVHANNWRDIESDTAKRCVTVASLFGDRGSAGYYGFLLFSPFALVVGFIVAPRLLRMGTAAPWTALGTFLAFPLAIRLLGRGLRRKTAADPMPFLALDGGTAQLNMLFGALYTAALIVAAFVPASR